jgi:hypothetical protein
MIHENNFVSLLTGQTPIYFFGAFLIVERLFADEYCSFVAAFITLVATDCLSD